MKQEKITIAEVKRLKEAAEKEKATHHAIMARIDRISSVQIGFNWFPEGLPAEEQMQIVQRGNQKEIMALLQAYANLCVSSYEVERFECANLCEEAQMYIYRQPIGFDAPRNYMLEHNRLHLAVEKALIDKDMYASIGQRKFSPEAEVYLLEEGLRKCREADKAFPLGSVNAYLEKNSFSDKAQVVLMKYLNLSSGADSVIDYCRARVKMYIDKYKNLCLEAQRKLVESGDSELIMLYILFSREGLQAEDELLERGNREEIEAYFKRYATL